MKVMIGKELMTGDVSPVAICDTNIFGHSFVLFFSIRIYSDIRSLWCVVHPYMYVIGHGWVSSPPEGIYIRYWVK